MSFRLHYMEAFQRRLEKIPQVLRPCVEYHLGEVKLSDAFPGRKVSFPHPPGMGYFFDCYEADGTRFQMIAHYTIGQDEESLDLNGLSCYPMVDPPGDPALSESDD